MITKFSHITINVLNQDSALDFYTNKLGFKVVTDVPMGPDSRWLTEVVQKNGTLFCIKNAKNGSKENQENARTL
jgi:catechol 2,3-dioxygenase-like lactoylglutathione lyase family enzyme